MPAPSAEHAWEFRGHVLRGGRPYGTVSLSARPHGEREGHWVVRDEIKPLKPQDFTVLQTAVLDRRLGAVSGSFHRRNTRGFLRARFTAAEDGYAMEHEADYYENRLDVETRKGIATLAGSVTFLRHVPAAKAVYRLRDFDPDPSGGDPYALDARVEVHGLANWNDGDELVEAWIASVTRGKQTLRLAFHPKTRALLGVVYVGLGIQIVQEGHAAGGLAQPKMQGLATPIELAIHRTRSLRKKLGLPRRPFRFLGEVKHAGISVGTVMLVAEPASVGGAPAWRVLESQTVKVGEAVIEHEVSGFLAQDLTVLKGERIDKRPEGTFHVTYRRKPGGIETIAHTKKGPQQPVLLGAPEGAITGVLPVLLFLRQAPDHLSDYVLPGWDPRFAQKPKAGTGTFTLSRSDTHVHVERVKEGLVARCARRDGWSFEVVLRPDDRRLLEVRGLMPKVDFAPRTASSPTGRADWYDAVDGSPTNWRQAFVKFGRGYHLPRRDLLADAFHWPSMVKQAIAQGRYAEGTPEAKIRDDWIDVFVKMSKNRTEADCDDLLFQMFMTSEETANADGSVSLRTLPAYGGHTYRMQAIDGRWWIVQID